MHELGIIGLGTMGRNLLLNFLDHGINCAGYDRDLEKVNILTTQSGSKQYGKSTLIELINSLTHPRKILLMVPSGIAVDSVIKELIPILEKDDIIIDGGNSHFNDTERRSNELKEKGIRYVGLGISGGEEGARKGPSLMIGGEKQDWNSLKPMFESIAANAGDQPCVAYLGNGAAGHYVKMVHNGIEYAIMELIGESYDILKNGLGLSNREIQKVLQQWSSSELQSFLLEISSKIFLKKDALTGADLIDLILDKAESKGTGTWCCKEAIDLTVGTPSIDVAVSMRNLSMVKCERIRISALFNKKTKQLTGEREKIIDYLENGLYTASMLSYAQGITLLHKGSKARQMEIPLDEVVRIWRNGCIIRSSMLELIWSALKNKKVEGNILSNKKIISILKKKQRGLRQLIRINASTGIPIPGFMAALSWLDAYTAETLPANLIQAQRDYFGAHTYQRNDREGFFHTDWS